MAFFDQKHGLTPLVPFFGSSFSFYNIIKPYFQSCFDQKQIKKKILIFWSKAWVNPFGKFRFSSLKKNLFLQSKNVSFLSRTLLHLISIEIEFVDQKHGLIPLKKCDFCDFEKFCFYTKIKVCFLSRTLLNLISSPILTEKK